jgi:hypothetical protein
LTVVTMVTVTGTVRGNSRNGGVGDGGKVTVVTIVTMVAVVQ